MTITKKILPSLVLCTMIVGLCTTFVMPKRAQAVGGVWIDTSFDFHSVMDNQKNFVWDRLATLFAKQLLHQMTASVVNWINSGFDGSPAFITNPQGFFLDTADQLTGQFIREGGPLSALCSPISIDLRLSLALDQTMSASRRYTCTLGAIVNNVNGTIEGFTSGDFSQGGWPGFISLTTEPQNNVYGSYLQAHSELLHLIGKKESSINKDLDRGGGFLSDKKCTDLPVDSEVALDADYGIDQASFAQLNSTGKTSTKTNEQDSRWDNASIEQKYNKKTGKVTYQRCLTTTPGSVISGLLGKQLSGPATELELADDINAVVNALVSQMVTQVLSGGLSNLSRGNSGGKPSYTSQLIGDINAERTREYGNAETQIATIYDPAITALTEYKGVYDQAVSLASNSRALFENARACFAAKSNDTRYNQIDRAQAQNAATTIATEMTAKVDPLLASLTAKQASIASKIADIQNTKAQLTVSGDVRGQITGSQTSIQAAIDAKTAAISGTTAAQKELTDVQKQTQILNATASSYQQACTSFPNSTLFSH